MADFYPPLQRIRFHAYIVTKMVNAVLSVVDQNPHWFDLDTSRQNKSTALKDTKTIHLRKQVHSPKDKPDTIDKPITLDCQDTGLMAEFQPAVGQLIDMCLQFEGLKRLGRVVITLLPANTAITWHKDLGLYHDTMKRFHVPLRTSPQCWFYSGHMAECPRVGEIWLMNNSIDHAVMNNGDEDRLVLTIDGAK